MTPNTKGFLRTQLLEMDRLAESAADDPLMSFAIESRRKSLEGEMANAPAEPSRPRTVLFFAGPPVMGSRGIDAKFAADVITPFLEMVKTQYSAQKPLTITMSTDCARSRSSRAVCQKAFPNRLSMCKSLSSTAMLGWTANDSCPRTRLRSRT